MSDVATQLARGLGDLLAPSAEPPAPAEFAQRLAVTVSELCPGCEVGVVLTGRGSEVAAAAGTTRSIAELEASGWRPADAALDGSVRRFELGGAAQPLGTIDVFWSALRTPGPDVELLEAFAAVVGAHLGRETELRAVRTRADQLEGALQSRVVIEQAKGMLAAHSGVPLHSAFSSLRKYARDHNARLSQVCESVISGSLELTDVSLEFVRMSADRRLQLRAEAIARWERLQVEVLTQRERAATIVSTSVELRVELDHARAERQAAAVGSAIDRPLRELRGRPAIRPLVVVADRRPSIHTFVVSTLGADRRLELATARADSIDAFAGCLVEQPELAIVSPDSGRAAEGLRLSELHRYCPDTRTLVVLEDQRDVAALAGYNVNAIVAYGDSSTLIGRALELCGVGG